MNRQTGNKWMAPALLNLMIVAVLGVLMRYKIAFSLPGVDQKYLQHAHSHFAFTGWVSLALMSMMIGKASAFTGKDLFPRYKYILGLHLISAYGMLLSFPVQGYGGVSIFFSTMSIFVAYIFAWLFWADLKKFPGNDVSSYWFRASLIFNVISSFGAFYLAYMMATKTASSQNYLASVYYYLHFQYNGWFFFVCMGLVSSWLNTAGVKTASQKSIFWLFALSCVPAFFLSALWLNIPVWVYIIVVIAAFCQVIAFTILYIRLWPKRFRLIEAYPAGYWWVPALSGLALGIKLLLQLGSTIPALSDLAFGFRPIVIGYLHLVLLGIITLFIIGYGAISGTITMNATSKYGTYIFIAGVILNEVLLMIQGVAAIDYHPVPYINELLLLAALVLLAGAVLLAAGQRRINSV